MKSLVWHGDTQLEIENLPDPEPSGEEVLLDVRMSGICGSDLHGYRGHPGPRVPPLVLGHEAVGTVAGRSGRFVPFPLAICGHCAACRSGNEHLCATRGLLGLDRPGVFAERVAVPEHALLPVPDDMPDEIAALTEPYAVAVSMINVDAVSAGQRVLVIGGGPIGALTVHAATQAGATVTAVDPLEWRREITTRLGAHVTLSDAALVPPRTFDLVIDAVGVEATVNAAIAAVRRGGRVTIVGLGAATGAMPIAELVREAITVRGHYAYTRKDFEQALQALAAVPPDTDWITRLPLDDGAAAFASLVEHPESHAKVLLEIGGIPA